MNDFDLQERSRKNTDDFVNTIRLEWNSPSLDGKVLLLVEDRDDCFFYYKFFNHQLVEIRTTKGCDKIRDIVSNLRCYIICFSIRDCDFLRLCNTPSEENIFLTDCHDHEMMCLSDKKTLHSLFDNFFIDFDNNLICDVYSNLRTLSYFKWYNMKYHLNCNFKSINPVSLSKSELTSFKGLYRIIKECSPKLKQDLSSDDFYEFISSNRNVSPKEIVNGHDFLSLFSHQIDKIVNQKFINDKKKSINSDYVRHVMYACFTMESFKKTNLYKQIRNWARKNNRKNLFASS